MRVSTHLAVVTALSLAASASWAQSDNCSRLPDKQCFTWHQTTTKGTSSDFNNDTGFWLQAASATSATSTVTNYSSEGNGEGEAQITVRGPAGWGVPLLLDGRTFVMMSGSRPDLGSYGGSVTGGIRDLSLPAITGLVDGHGHTFSLVWANLGPGDASVFPEDNKDYNNLKDPHKWLTFSSSSTPISAPPTTLYATAGTTVFISLTETTTAWDRPAGGTATSTVSGVETLYAVLDNAAAVPIPEPATYSLLAGGLLVFALTLSRRSH